MKKQRDCERCGTKYTTGIIKVYVFKSRYCPSCDLPMFSDNVTKIHRCRRCGFEVQFNDDNTIGKLKVVMRGATRDSVLVRKNKAKGYEADNKLEPKNRLCQRCRNIRQRIENEIIKRTNLDRGEIRKLSSDEVFNNLQTQLRQKIQQEQRTKVEEERKMAHVRAVKEKLEQEKTKMARLDTPFGVDSPNKVKKKKNKD